MRLSIITRTFRRPVLLWRAARSVIDAKTAEVEWIIVDDDDSIRRETSAVAEYARAAGMDVRVLCSGRTGRSGAANTGLAAAYGDFVHFHDDDDTVAPTFYATVLNFLNENDRYKGARTFCWRVFERLEDGRLVSIKKRRIYPERRTASLFDVAEVFAYPPIGTVLDRNVLLEIGGFNEEFAVGEDYDLLLRFLLKADLGTIHETLANVHVRQAETGDYANSPIERCFPEEEMLFLNSMIRADINANRIGLGHLLFMGRLARRRRGVIDFLDAARRRMGF